MVRGEPHFSRLFSSAYPDGARSSDKREGIVADQLSRARQFETDRVVCKWADRVEFIRNAQHDPRCVGTVGYERRVVRQKGEFLVHALAGQAARNDLLALDVTVDPHVAPTDANVLCLTHERGVFEMRKLLTIGVGLGHQFAVDVKLEVVAVRSEEHTSEL